MINATEWLLFHLWKKNPKTGNCCKGIKIPRTILYRWAMPHLMYFSTPEDEIERVEKEKVDLKDFREYLEDNTHQNCSLVYYIPQTGKKGQKQSHVKFDYIKKNQIYKFLFEKEKNLVSMIQEFRYPKDSRSSKWFKKFTVFFLDMIKVSWSKKFTTAIQKTNKNHFNNNKILLADRISTFEGGQHLVEIKCVASDISKRNIEIVCGNISEHIVEVSGGNIQITWMTLYFKVDSQGNLWFQFCTRVKVRDYVSIK